MLALLMGLRLATLMGPLSELPKVSPLAAMFVSPLVLLKDMLLLRGGGLASRLVLQSVPLLECSLALLLALQLV